MNYTIATWNVNSLNVRLPHVLSWLRTHQPDILALQEIKCEQAKFPYEAFESLGYFALVSGQKTYNGVAILSREQAQDSSLIFNFPGFPDEQRRVLGARIKQCFILNVYVPNGAVVGGDKYAYKLAWLSHLYAFAKEYKNESVIVLGDFNIAPTDDDVYEPLLWKDQVLVSPPEREAWQDLMDLGFVDCFRARPVGEANYSWWDYRQASFRRNLGLRIDHIVASQAMAPLLQSCHIDKTPRGWERPSDHAPVVAMFSLP